MPTIQPPPLSPRRFSVQEDDNSFKFQFSAIVRKIPLPTLILIFFLCLASLYFTYWLIPSIELILGSLLFFSSGVFLGILWVNTSKEIVEISDQGISIKKHLIFGPIQSNHYSSQYIKNLSFANSLHHIGNAKAAVGLVIQGPFNFQYGGKKFFFGMGIPQEEAEEVLALIAKKFPQYTNDKSTSESLI